MRNFSFAALACAAGLAVAAPAAPAAGVAYPDANWTEVTIPVPDGTQLHGDVLRPKGVGPDEKVPVIVSIGPYFNHSGQVGPAGPVQGAGYDPVGPSEGPSERFQDFVEGAKLFTRGQKYAFVMVDLRGYGGSTGCLDWGGPGEIADTVAAIRWAAKQEWSTGKVGTYGKSYDGMTGLMGAAARPEGLAAVVAQEPVYDNYRYLFGDGIRRLNSVATPALYDAIAATPGPVGDVPADPTYNVYGNAQDAQRPGCFAGNWLDQQNDDHGAPYWRVRNIITNIKGSQVPIFVTQGMTENNTAPDGFAEFLQSHPGPEYGWLGPWNHVRGAELDGNKLAMGRAGFYDEVMSFYDQYLADIAPTVNYAPFAIQSVTTGKWRPEAQWPPADRSDVAVAELKPGSYADNGSSTRSTNSGVWTISEELPYDVTTAGAGTAVVDVSSPTPRSNLVVDVYDLDKGGKGPLVARNGSLIRSNGKVYIDLMSADWTFKKGRRIGIRVTDTNTDWWLATVPTRSTVTVYGGRLTLPFLRYERTQKIDGESGTTRQAWMNNVVTAPPAAVEAAVPFTLPPPLEPQPAAMKAQLDSFQ